jgi:hypothetical protein
LDIQAAALVEQRTNYFKRKTRSETFIEPIAHMKKNVADIIADYTCVINVR